MGMVVTPAHPATLFTPLQPGRAAGSPLQAFTLALGLHLLIVLALPYMQMQPSPPPQPVEIELSQLSPPPTAAPAETPPDPQPMPPVPQPQPRPTPPRPTPVREQAMPLLTARADAPADVQAPTVPDTSAAPIPAQVTPSAPESAPAQPVSAAPASTAATSASATEKSSQASDDEAWQGYGQLLYDQVSRNKVYPQLAIRRHLQGHAKVSVRFDKGRPVEYQLMPPGSGHQVLDNAALEMLKKAVAALPVQGDLANKSFTVIVPVDFKLEG